MTSEALSGRLARRASTLLFWLGVALLCTWAFAQVRTGVFQLIEQRRFERELAEARAVTPPEEAEASAGPPAGGGSAELAEVPVLLEEPMLDQRVSEPAPAVGERLAKIVIPRLRLEAVVVEGVGKEELRLAVGHVPGTALPGRPGNVALAAHRDSFFRGLGKLGEGDTILVTTLDGEHRYRVEWTRVVAPGDVWVLDPTGGALHELTLITCFPFNYVGAAPDRYVVRARRIEP